MALALIDKDKQPSAAPWYAAAPVEPIGNQSTIKVDKTIEIDKMTVEKIFDEILSTKTAKDILIVCHGSKEGLAIPLKHGSSGGAGVASIFAISQDHATVEDNELGGKSDMPAVSVKRAAETTTLSEADVTSLRAKMNRVRAMKLNHIAFRACNMGESTDTMRTFRNLFGAASVSAPKVYDSYGGFAPGNLEPNLSEWVKAKKTGRFYVIVEGDVAFGIRWVPNTISYQIVFAGQTSDGIKAWVKKHIRGDYESGHVVYHGQAVTPTEPNAPSILFVKDAAFLANLVYQAK